MDTKRRSAPPVGDAAQAGNEKLDIRTWTLLSSLISGPYATSSARAVKSLLTPLPSKSTSPDLAVRYSKGAARTIRLALRNGAENRIAIARVSQLEDTSSPSGMPVYTDEMADILQMAHSAIFMWDVSKVRGILARGIKEWLVFRGEHEKERVYADENVLLEILNVVQDIVDEALGLDRPFSDEEGCIVGEVLAEGVKFVAMARYVLSAFIFSYQSC